MLQDVLENADHQPLTTKDQCQLDNEPSKRERWAQVKQHIVFNNTYWSLVIFTLLGTKVTGSVTPIVGANYFSSKYNLSKSKAYIKYAYYSGLSASLSGLIGFLLDPLLGQMSDIYGRKPLLMFVWFVQVPSIICLAFTDNIWYYLFFNILTGLSGQFLGSPAVWSAALSDTIPKHLRTDAFSIIWIPYIIFGTIPGPIIGTWMFNHLNHKSPYIWAMINTTIAFLWLLFAVPETCKNVLQPRAHVQLQQSTDESDYNYNDNYGTRARVSSVHAETSKLSKHDINPLRVFFLFYHKAFGKDKKELMYDKTTKRMTGDAYDEQEQQESDLIDNHDHSNHDAEIAISNSINNEKYNHNHVTNINTIAIDTARYRIVVWICILGFVTSLPEVGLPDLYTSYCDALLQLVTNNNASNNLTSSLNTICGTVIIPLIAKYYGFKNVTMIGFGLFILCLFMIGAIVCYVGVLFDNKQFIYLVYLDNIWYGMLWILLPYMSGFLSKYLENDELGIGIGLQHGIKGITAAIAPFSFALLLKEFDDSSEKFLLTLPFFIGICLVVFGVVILTFPLNRAIHRYWSLVS